jgi:alpha-glucosidase
MARILTFALTLILTFTKTGHGQSDIPVFTGNLTSVKLSDGIVTVTTENAVTTLTAYLPQVLRIRINKTMPTGDFSYAVIQKPTSVIRDVKRNQDSTTCSTDSLLITLWHKPFRITVKNLKNDIISDDYSSLPVSWQGTEVTCYKTMFPDEKFLGLGEKTGNLNKRGSAYVNWNSDVPAYAVNHDPLYQSIPFFIGIHNKVTYGIFLDNSFRTRFNFGASTDEAFSSFSSVDGEMNYYLFGASTVAGIIRDYTWLTGRMTMPPYWSLGYQQCRWSYFPESQVMNIAQQFRDKEIPCDVIYLDIDYMDKYKIFTWDNKHFPDPKAMITKLNTMGFHVVTIVDPGIKIDSGYFAYNEGLKEGYFAKYPDGRFYTGSVWPGRCHFPDFTNDKVRKWWGRSFDRLVQPGVEGFWNDMNEPSAWGQSIPDIVMFDFEDRKGSMREAHNIYGLKMSQATYEGTRNLLGGKRPFVLTRAGYSGIQRYSSVWTGDNDATDEHMLLSARMVTGLGLSGVSFAGPDVGGFMGNPSEQLFTRWMSLGVFTPFYRNHSAWDTRAKEPWAFGLNVERTVKKMISYRYRLLPYIYSSFYQSVTVGMPVARSLAIDYTFDDKVYWYVYQNQYMFGDNLLVVPVSCNQNAAKIYLPEGEWYRLSSDQKYKGNQEVTVDAPLDDLPVFVKGSGILPLQSVIRHTGEKPSETLEIHLYNGNVANNFIYYEDDGVTYNYESGVFYKRQIQFDPASKLVRFGEPEGKGNSKFNNIRLIFHGFDDLMTVSLNGVTRQVKLQSTTQRVLEFPLQSEILELTY